MINNSEVITIDVVVPVFNGEKYIVKALQSICCQTYKVEKIVVVDDGSTDQTREVVSLYQSSIKIQYVKKPNGGPNSARNVGIAHCSSNYIAFLDSDDEWFIDKLEEQVKLIRKSEYANLGAVYCGCIIVDEDSQLIRSFPIDKDIRGSIYNKLFDANKIVSSASGVLIKRACFDTVGLFDETLRVGEDWDMWLRLAECYQWDFAPRDVVRIRRHENSAQSNKLYSFSHLIDFYNKWGPRIPAGVKSAKKWRKDVLAEIVLLFPDPAPVKLIHHNMTPRTRQIIFPLMKGSVLAYLFLSSPLILLQLCKRAAYKTGLLTKLKRLLQ